MGIPVLEVGNKQLSTSADKANAFTKFFSSQHTLIEPVGHKLPLLHMYTNKRLTDVSTTPDEVRGLLGALELGKAHSMDGVSVCLLKETTNSINVPLCALTNESFTCGKVPFTWKKANVSPVHKKTQNLQWITTD